MKLQTRKQNAKFSQDNHFQRRMRCLRWVYRWAHDTLLSRQMLSVHLSYLLTGSKPSSSSDPEGPLPSPPSPPIAILTGDLGGCTPGRNVTPDRSSSASLLSVSPFILGSLSTDGRRMVTFIAWSRLSSVNSDPNLLPIFSGTAGIRSSSSSSSPSPGVRLLQGGVVGVVE